MPSRGSFASPGAPWLALGCLLALPSSAAGQQPILEPTLPPVVRAASNVRPRPPRQLAIHLGATSGVFSSAMLVGSEDMTFSSDSSLLLSGDLHLLWSRPGQEVSKGLSLSGFSSLGPHWGGDDAQRVFGGQAGFLIRARGFWGSSGLGLACFSPLASKSAPLTMPLFFLTLGYDLPLAPYLALRFQLTGASMLVVNHAAASIGLATGI